MMNRVVLGAAALLISAAAIAGPGQKKKAPATIHCAVMTARTVNVADATKNHMFADYKGKRYYFCCGMCPTSFKKNPAAYTKSASLPTPKPAKG